MRDGVIGAAGNSLDGQHMWCGGGQRGSRRQLNSHRVHSKSIELIITTKLQTKSLSIGIQSHFSRMHPPHLLQHAYIDIGSGLGSWIGATVGWNGVEKG